jgi:hypothetical protein
MPTAEEGVACVGEDEDAAAAAASGGLGPAVPATTLTAAGAWSAK